MGGIKLKNKELAGGITRAFKMFPDLEANILGVIRDENFLILRKTDKMKLNDKAYVVINSSQLNRTLVAFGHEEKIAKKILKDELARRQAVKYFEDVNTN